MTHQFLPTSSKPSGLYIVWYNLFPWSRDQRPNANAMTQCISFDIYEMFCFILYRMFRLDDPGNPVSIYATSSLDPYPFVLIMASKSFFGDIRNFNDGHMDYETYLRRHWERESELPRLSYMSHKKLVEACGYMVSFRKQNFHLTSFRFKLVKNWSRSVKEGCGGVLLRQGQICAAAHVDFEIKRRWLKGSPVLVNLGGRVFTVGLAVHEANFKKSPLSIITINSIYDAYQNIGCNELLFGRTSIYHFYNKISLHPQEFLEINKFLYV